MKIEATSEELVTHTKRLLEQVRKEYNLGYSAGHDCGNRAAKAEQNQLLILIADLERALRFSPPSPSASTAKERDKAIADAQATLQKYGQLQS